jgi:hypothetical protein
VLFELFEFIPHSARLEWNIDTHGYLHATDVRDFPLAGTYHRRP